MVFLKRGGTPAVRNVTPMSLFLSPRAGRETGCAYDDAVRLPSVATVGAAIAAVAIPAVAILGVSVVGLRGPRVVRVAVVALHDGAVAVVVAITVAVTVIL